MTKRFPDWIRRPWPSGDAFQETRELLDGLALKTVCQSAHCPNQSECWDRRAATLMVMGNVCTRHCSYCAVQSGRPGELDTDEPAKVAEAVRRLGLRHAVLTSVTRDDLPGQGAGHIAAVVRAVKAVSPETTIELLVQDFNRDRDAIGEVLASGPEIFSHNIETVARIYPQVRDRRFSYGAALDVLRMAAEEAADQGRVLFVKSAFMLGMGETDAEVMQTLEDLHAAGCDAVNIGQYLQPTPRHAPVVEYVHPDRFARFQQAAYDLGFNYAVAGPFVRSSYRSETLIEQPFAQERLNARRAHAQAAAAGRNVS